MCSYVLATQYDNMIRIYYLITGYSASIKSRFIMEFTLYITSNVWTVGNIAVLYYMHIFYTVHIWVIP